MRLCFLPPAKIKLCQLGDDGQIVKYDVCGNDRSFYDSSLFEYIGYGVVHEIDNKSWNDPPIFYHFWRHK